MSILQRRRQRQVRGLWVMVRYFLIHMLSVDIYATSTPYDAVKKIWPEILRCQSTPAY